MCKMVWRVGSASSLPTGALPGNDSAVRVDCHSTGDFRIAPPPGKPGSAHGADLLAMVLPKAQLNRFGPWIRQPSAATASEPRLVFPRAPLLGREGLSRARHQIERILFNKFITSGWKSMEFDTAAKNAQT
ncbi:hypothetical protein CB1_036599002 [Camelus ferus]|nr:hypothetical protein CB1_036599002 [Camelus ferus]